MSGWRRTATDGPRMLHAVRLGTTSSLQPIIGFGWLVAIIGLVVYGSLIPFRFHSNVLSANNGFGLWLITWHPSTIEDFITNLMVYAVFGFVVFFVMRCHRQPIVSAFFYTCLMGTLLSVFVESCQSATVARVASWLDVASDILGTCLGAIAAYTVGIYSRRFNVHFRHRLQSHPYSTLALGITLALSIFHLFPFDFVHTTDQMKTVFLRADWQVIAMIQPSYWLTDPHVVLAHLEGAGWFALLAYIFFAGRMEHANARNRAFISTIRHGFILAVMIECLQLLTLSHVFEFADVILRCVATIVGACLARSFSYPTSEVNRSDKRVPMMSKSILLALVVIQVVALLISAYYKGQTQHGVSGEIANVPLPFMSLWQSSLRVALGQLVSTLVYYACLSWPLVTLMRRMKIVDAGLISGCFIVFVACRAGMFEQGTSLFAQDFTTPILAIIAHIVVYRMNDYIRSSMGSLGYEDTSSLLNTHHTPPAHAPIA